MKIKKSKTGELEITANVYQAKNGGIYINFSDTPILLTKRQAESLAYEVNEFDSDLFNKFYQ